MVSVCKEASISVFASSFLPEIFTHFILFADHSWGWGGRRCDSNWLWGDWILRNLLWPIERKWPNYNFLIGLSGDRAWLFDNILLFNTITLSGEAVVNIVIIFSLPSLIIVPKIIFIMIIIIIFVVFILVKLLSLLMVWMRRVITTVVEPTVVLSRVLLMLYWLWIIIIRRLFGRFIVVLGQIMSRVHIGLVQIGYILRSMVWIWGARVRVAIFTLADWSFHESTTHGLWRVFILVLIFRWFWNKFIVF